MTAAYRPPRSAPVPAISAPKLVASVPEALQAPEPAPGIDTKTPFADTDTTWANGTTRNSTPIFDTKFFTPEIRLDVNYLQSFKSAEGPHDRGFTEEFRSGEFQIEQVSFGGDFHWHNVRPASCRCSANLPSPRPATTASFGSGNWDLQGAYNNMSEANAGYHFDVSHGLNVDAGIFVSYIGLFSLYNFDNWVYQPSFVSSNNALVSSTGLRVQWFPTQHLKSSPG